MSQDDSLQHALGFWYHDQTQPSAPAHVIAAADERRARDEFDFRYAMEDVHTFGDTAAERMQARWLWFLSLFGRG